METVKLQKDLFGNQTHKKMTETELINEVTAELTNSCALPYSLNPVEIKRLINRAARFFYENYQYAVEDGFLIMPLEIYEHPEFKANRKIQLPDCIVSVTEIREVSGIGMLGTPDKDFADSKLLGAEIFLSPFQGDNLIYRTAMYSYFDLAKAYDLVTIAYDWNRNSKRITILGRNPHRNTYARVMTKIPLESLYDDELFIRYVSADAKINLGRTLQVFGYQLPGGITINFDGIKQDGVQELMDIKQQINDENSPNWFLQWN